MADNGEMQEMRAGKCAGGALLPGLRRGAEAAWRRLCLAQFQLSGRSRPAGRKHRPAFYQRFVKSGADDDAKTPCKRPSACGCQLVLSRLRQAQQTPPDLLPGLRQRVVSTQTEGCRKKNRPRVSYVIYCLAGQFVTRNGGESHAEKI